MNLMNRLSLAMVSFCLILAAFLQVGAPATARADSGLRQPRFPTITAVKQALVAEASKVHVILLVYGPQSDFGVACRNDVRGFKSLLEEGFELKKDRLLFHDYTGTNPATGQLWLPAEILQDVEHIQVGPQESIVVFHSGHGHIEDLTRPEETHYLAIDRGTIARKRLQDTLRAQNPRGFVMLTDCCSSFAPGLSRQHHGQARFNAASVQNLFLRFSGRVSITAAETGKAALPNYSGPNPGGGGSAFTVALLRLLCAGDKTYLSWNELFPVLREETFQASSNLPGAQPHFAYSFAIEERAFAD